jgi:hypothetical protein
MGRKKTIARFKISNKSFIHSPGKEKAKTSKLSLGRIGESAGDISGPGIIDKT